MVDRHESQTTHTPELPRLSQDPKKKEQHQKVQLFSSLVAAGSWVHRRPVLDAAETRGGFLFLFYWQSKKY